MLTSAICVPFGRQWNAIEFIELLRLSFFFFCRLFNGAFISARGFCHIFFLDFSWLFGCDLLVVVNVSFRSVFESVDGARVVNLGLAVVVLEQSERRTAARRAFLTGAARESITELAVAVGAAEQHI